jgi:hypothetical protein
MFVDYLEFRVTEELQIFFSKFYVNTKIALVSNYFVQVCKVNDLCMESLKMTVICT